MSEIPQKFEPTVPEKRFEIPQNFDPIAPKKSIDLESYGTGAIIDPVTGHISTPENLGLGGLKISDSPRSEERREN
jgi:hypothetical protein